MAAESSIRFKWFNTLQEATSFAGKQPNESVLEIKYYDNNQNKKPNRT